MFKGILPSKRVASSTDFTMITPLGDANTNINNVENMQPTTNKGKPALSSKGHPSNGDKKHQRSESKWLKKNQAPKDVVEPVADTNLAFDQLLDELQIPPALRPKLTGMDSTVKAAMLKSSHVLTLPRVMAEEAGPTTPNRSMGLRRTRSTDSMGSLAAMRNDSELDLRPPQLPFAPQVSAQHPSSIGSPRKASGQSHTRGMSFDGSRSNVYLPMSSSSVDLLSPSKNGKEKGSSASKTMSPAKIISILLSTSSTQIDVENVKKLRLMLRNEPASWTQSFLEQDGYSALLTRLNEILEVEWREEQHDDQVLHELLRCFKGLSTSSIGQYALRSSCPTPCAQLVSLLFSDKKPGDVGTRQLIVELLLILFELYPPSALPAPGSPRRAHREAWESSSDLPGAGRLVTLPSPHKTLYSLVRSLLLTAAPLPAEAPAVPLSPHEFIESLHKPRLYKTYLQELSDVCRDYFWVFCHPNNTIWILAETDESKVEKPRAPGGMTGGVEFEAMSYFTTHLRLINAVAKSAADLNLSKDNELSAYQFHHDLFLSGLERILLISRKASTTYYPTLHLEIARYMEHASRAGYEFPWAVSRLMGPPPASACKVRTPPSAPSTPAGRKTPSGARDRR